MCSAGALRGWPRIDQQHIGLRSGQDQSGAQTRRAGADDDDIVRVFSFMRPRCATAATR